MIKDFAQSLFNLPLAGLIREDPNLFPTIETAHVVAVTLVFGSILFVDVRLVIGRAYRSGAMSLMRELLPFTWIGFGLAVVTGGLMFISQAPDYVQNPWFLAKMALLATAGANMAVFHLTSYRTASEWGEGAPPKGARLSGLLSMLIWTLIILCGRWIAF